MAEVNLLFFGIWFEVFKCGGWLRHEWNWHL